MKKIERAPWFPPRTQEKMLEVLNNLDNRVVGSGRFLFDVDLAKSYLRDSISKGTPYDFDFFRVYSGIISSYNRFAAAMNRGEPLDTYAPEPFHCPSSSNWPT